MALPERKRPARPLGKVKGTGQKARAQQVDDQADDQDQVDDRQKKAEGKRKKKKP